MPRWYHGGLYQRLGLRRNCDRCGRTVWVNEDEAKREAKILKKRYGLKFEAQRCRGSRWGSWHVGVKR